MTVTELRLRERVRRSEATMKSIKPSVETFAIRKGKIAYLTKHELKEIKERDASEVDKRQRQRDAMEEINAFASRRAPRITRL
ncbi:hypothetical protein K2173_026393 [Erythroxylum novogranatense]|uniref:Uncharacterized protein n=1 Tax=Erythroxylum novogranatense TaxID=1862640 RepID=A0AAV8SN78_9ROSI|nr:hypothetical protein K2173_026393 [Erythroxylum novogranatense]